MWERGLATDRRRGEKHAPKSRNRQFTELSSGYRLPTTIRVRLGPIGPQGATGQASVCSPAGRGGCPAHEQHAWFTCLHDLSFAAGHAHTHIAGASTDSAYGFTQHISRLKHTRGASHTNTAAGSSSARTERSEVGVAVVGLGSSTRGYDGGGAAAGPRSRSCGRMRSSGTRPCV